MQVFELAAAALEGHLQGGALVRRGRDVQLDQDVTIELQREAIVQVLGGERVALRLCDAPLLRDRDSLLGSGRLLLQRRPDLRTGARVGGWAGDAELVEPLPLAQMDEEGAGRRGGGDLALHAHVAHEVSTARAGDVSP